MNKEKLNDFIITSGITLLLGGLVSIGAFVSTEVKKVVAEEEQPLLTQPLKASYDDESYTITLTADELNNYTWENLYTLNILDELTLNYNDEEYTIYGSGSDGVQDYEDTNQVNYINFVYNYEELNSAEGSTIILKNFVWLLNKTVNNFEYELLITTNSISYQIIKQAIELDVQANNPQYDFYLSSYQLNNNTYTYLANQLNDLQDSSNLEDTYLIYNNNKYLFNDFTTDDVLSFQYTINETDFNTIKLNLYTGDTETYAKFVYQEEIDGYSNDLPFTNSVYFYDAEFLQDNLNAPVNWLSFLNSFISLLTGGLVTTASALGSGISAYVGSILVSGTSMSAFASVIFIFGGIALAFTLGRWVLNFITSLGNRNR